MGSRVKYIPLRYRLTSSHKKNCYDILEFCKEFCMLFLIIKSINAIICVNFEDTKNAYS